MSNGRNTVPIISELTLNKSNHIAIHSIKQNESHFHNKTTTTTSSLQPLPLEHDTITQHTQTDHHKPYVQIPYLLASK